MLASFVTNIVIIGEDFIESIYSASHEA